MLTVFKGCDCFSWFQETVVDYSLCNPICWHHALFLMEFRLRVPRSCQATGQISSCCYRESTFHLTLRCVWGMDRFHASTTSLNVVIEGSLPSCMLTVIKIFVTLPKPLEPPLCCANRNKSFTKCFIDVSRRFRSCFP